MLIFDEPTTGLDPQNRHDIWKFINSLKQQGRTILLTTHILEEADFLSDRICIMNYGRVKVTGTSAELKRKIGAGFKLTVILKDNSSQSIETLKKFIAKHCPSSSILDYSGGAMLFILPFKAGAELKIVLKKYEQTKEIQELVDDFSVSNSSLEEVFIEVTKDENKEYNILQDDETSNKINNSRFGDSNVHNDNSFRVTEEVENIDACL